MLDQPHGEFADSASLGRFAVELPPVRSLDSRMVQRSRTIRHGATRPAPEHHDAASEHDTEQIQATRLLVESAAIALGAGRLTPALLDEARVANEALLAATTGDDAMWQARRFHLILLSGCQNARLLELLAHDAPLPVAARGAADAAEIGAAYAEHAAVLEMFATTAPQREIERALRRHALGSAICSGC